MPFLTRENIVTCAGMSGAFNDGTVMSKTLILDPELMGGNFWTAKTGGVAGIRGGSAVLNGYGYTSCTYSPGTTDSGTAATNLHSRYDDVADTWTTKTNPAVATASPGTWTVDGRYFRLQGLISTSLGVDSGLYIYNETNNTWLTSSHSGLAFAYDKTHGAMIDGYGFVFGGSNFAIGGINGISRFDPATTTFSNQTAMTTATFAGASFKFNELLNLVGGDNGAVSAVGQRFNHATNSWSALNGAMGTAKRWCGSWGSGGLGYIASGQTTSAVSTATVDEYNPEADAYLNRAVITTATAAPTHFALNANGYVFGGTNSVAYQYRSTSWYAVPGAIHRTLRTPTRVNVGITANGRAATFPVRIRTDGTNWKYMEANADSLLKQGNILTTVLATSGAIRDFELQIGVPRWHGGVGGGSWGSRASVTAVKASAGGEMASGYGYSVMGALNAGTLQSTNYQLNDSLNVWNTRAVGGITQAYRDEGCFGLNGLLYIAGGADITPTYQTAVSYFDDVANAWGTRTGLTTARSQAAAYALNGFSYIVGGKDGGGSKTTNEQYNDSTNAWATKTVLTAARRGAGAIAISGFGYVCAGHDGTVSQATVYEYNDFADAWTTKTAITTIREGISAFALGALGFVTDGVDAGSYKSETQQFDRASNIWSTRAADGFGARAYASVFAVNGGGFVANGNNGADTASVRRYSQADTQMVLAVTLLVEETR